MNKLLFVAMCSLLLVVGCQTPSAKLALANHAVEQDNYNKIFNYMRADSAEFVYEAALAKLKSGEDQEETLKWACGEFNKLIFLAVQNQKSLAMGREGVDTYIYANQGDLYLIGKAAGGQLKDIMSKTQTIIKAAQTQPISIVLKQDETGITPAPATQAVARSKSRLNLLTIGQATK